MTRKSTKPGWKKWRSKKSQADLAYAGQVSGFTEPLRTSVWGRASASGKYHLVDVNIPDIKTLHGGRFVEGMAPRGTCPTSRKVDWAGLGYLTGSATPQFGMQCAHCNKLPKVA